MIKTLHVPIYRDSDHSEIHTATIRSNWEPEDYEDLAEIFPNCHVESQRQRRRRGGGSFKWFSQPLSELGEEGFEKMKKYSTQNLPDIWFRNRDGVWEQSA